MGKKEALQSWEKYCDMYNAGEDFSQFNFAPSIAEGDIFRFNARYSFFREFQAISLSNYNESTSRAYSQMMKLTLLWGVLESNMNVTGKTRNDFDNSYNPTRLSSLLTTISTSDIYAIYRFIQNADGTNSTHQRHLEEFTQGNSFGLTYLVSAVRNSFAHGVLTPHSGSKKPKVMASLCESLIDFYIPVIEAEFNGLVESHPNSANY
ncbi:hypothetical protein ACPD0O_003477 [Vibrio cholerae]